MAPPPSCLKLNYDVSVRRGKNFISIRATIRDSSGMVVAAVSKSMVGNISVDLGELLTLREGLILAKCLNLVINFVEVDASLIASMLNLDNSCLGDAMSIVSDIKALCFEVGGCSFQAITRSFNSLAHALAALAFSSGEELLWWDVHPSCIFRG
ncbi:hypothetical protein QYF36_006873 [Acer negundo]|nr:hypothetical protein QYF36_006873 [Acer negundo]